MSKGGAELCGVCVGSDASFGEGCSRGVGTEPGLRLRSSEVLEGSREEALVSYDGDPAFGSHGG